MAENKSEITFHIEMDENNVPEKIKWKGEGNEGNCDSIMLSMWDKDEQNTLRIDLWTKDMQVEQMKLFTYQSMLTTADAMARATGDENAADELRQFAQNWGLKQEIIKRGQ